VLAFVPYSEQISTQRRHYLKKNVDREGALELHVGPLIALKDPCGRISKCRRGKDFEDTPEGRKGSAEGDRRFQGILNAHSLCSRLIMGKPGTG
jgi:hypothetical protein